MYCISRDTGTPLGWKWRRNIKSITQHFLFFFFQLYYPCSNFNYTKNTIYIWCFEKRFLSLTRHKGMWKAKHTTKVLFSFPSFEQYVHLFCVCWYSDKWSACSLLATEVLFLLLGHQNGTALWRLWCHRMKFLAMTIL